MRSLRNLTFYEIVVHQGSLFCSQAYFNFQHFALHDITIHKLPVLFLFAAKEWTRLYAKAK